MKNEEANIMNKLEDEIRIKKNFERQFEKTKIQLQNRNKDLACSEQKILVFQQELEVENNAIAEFHKQPLATPLSISKKIEGNTEITTAVDRMVDFERKYKILVVELKKKNEIIYELKRSLEEEFFQRNELNQLLRKAQNNFQLIEEGLELGRNLVLLKTQNDQFTTQLEENEKKIEELKQKIFLLRNQTRKVEGGIDFYLQTEISRLRIRIAELTEKLANQESKIPLDIDNDSAFCNRVCCLKSLIRKDIKSLTEKVEKTSKERDEILYKFIHSSIRYLRMASRLEGLEYELKSLKKEFGIQESGCNRQEIIKNNDTNSCGILPRTNLKRTLNIYENGIIPLEKLIMLAKRRKETVTTNQFPNISSISEKHSSRLRFKRKHFLNMAMDAADGMFCSSDTFSDSSETLEKKSRPSF
ncbi:unnamed protein product [Dracunculus medinensis]|uniref:Uncharacterized protein n=1 Tax=Dracunculus medinensis TaxID=318479 RepID=A0A0N4U4S9_DRAME|nr:unnamed protein product [Dracunculus medinensis]